jgi:hypothetical protein
MTVDKLAIKNEMAEFDRKNRDFYDSLDEQEKKKFAPFLMIRWGSSVGGNPDLQAYYLMSCNENLNKHFFDISASKHKKFQWLLATTVSPGMGTQYHQWISLKKRESTSKSAKFFRELYPHMKDDEIRLLSELNDRNDIKQMAKELGWDDRRIKSDL